MAKKKKPIVCWECKKAFKTEAACQNHADAKNHQWRPSNEIAQVAAAVHNSGISTSPVAANREPVLSDSKRDALSSHYWRSAYVAKKACSQCQQFFEHAEELKEHYGQDHPALKWEYNGFYLSCDSSVPSGPPRDTDVPEHLKCSTCKRSFENEQQLQHHVVKQNTCDVCKIHFLSAKTLRKHCDEEGRHQRVDDHLRNETSHGSLSSNGDIATVTDQLELPKR
ncbi:hypothetical protein C8Q79DRAFT_678094 [Trametes meyenii]|nr:hypothetical protein C8Q79DRAFT_678094 [Trametes meyenii]